MKQIKFEKHTFMVGAYIDLKLCDRIIEYHKAFRHRSYQGTVGPVRGGFVDKSTKESLGLVHWNENNLRWEAYSTPDVPSADKYWNVSTSSWEDI